MILLILQILFGIACAIGIPLGIISAIIYNGNLKSEKRRLPPNSKHIDKRLPRDSHSAAFFDGMITNEVLDDLGDMFK